MVRIASTATVLLAVLASSPMAQPDYSDWSEPASLGSVINSVMFDASPALSKDGLSLYFTSNRPGGQGANDLWVSQRNSDNEPWGAPVNLGPIVNTGFGDFTADLSRDGHWLYFASNRPGGAGRGDIWVSYRQYVHDDFDWQPPVNAGLGVNSPDGEENPSFVENDDTGVPQLFFQRGLDLYVSDLLPDGTFGPSVLIPELSGAAFDGGLSVRFDGLEAFFFSTRAGGLGGTDLWTATRDTVFDPWSAPTTLRPLVNSVSQDVDPHIASDRETLYFHSNRPGGVGGHDLYVSTRTKRNAVASRTLFQATPGPRPRHDARDMWVTTRTRRLP